jgi:hypothetical protein
MQTVISLKRLIGGAAVISATAMLIISCGGGGTSSGGGGGLDKTSTVVLNVNSVSGGAAFLTPSRTESGAALAVSLFAEMLAGTAWAGTAGVQVLLDGVLVGTTDANGDIMFPATPGLHTITLVSGTAQASFQINVPEDTIVTITDITLEGEKITYNPPDYGDGTGGLAHKTTICHKAKNTISVADPSVPAHLAHGDYIGPCAVASPETPTITTSGGKNNGGKKKS